MARSGEPANLDDLPDLVDVFRTAFVYDSVRKAFPPTPAGHEYLRQMFEKCIKSEPGSQQSKIYVVRDDKGKPVSLAVYYIVRPDDGGCWPWQKRLPKPVDGVSEIELENFFNPMAIIHHESMKEEPHIFLEILGTHSAYQKQGCGTALLELGNKLADEMDYACYLDAAPMAQHLYQTMGYAKQSHGENARWVAMIRKKKSERT